ncbi:endonuclease/exonuclease/phosphatase family protein [Pimelobacter simplex]|uniref:endonuclease/exonuclease/phosphatase family protein n=1 Tax=Nocardioides simplex TaxID=2045 RepID=UPI00214FE01B|nr:endonuclease/exonuclease/phosphatase family protein [Pimelobacter simplex]UUW87773.1 endonuclease/exonuclease/phosphatase family protein [Pimelobacter simplex]UUW97278.1 endonuclease/exonuclease/phosphatase family protein [Pimelobacter simplex]
MRIATWNLEGKWTSRHHGLVKSLRADLLLLTEVVETVEIRGFDIHFGGAEMQPGRRWAAVAAGTRLRPLPAPHAATALAEFDGLRVASSILPWRNAGGAPTWTGRDQASRTAAAVAAIETVAPIVWGGDWNHELTGRLNAGSRGGRVSILRALERLGLHAPTDASPHRKVGAYSINHVAVPAFWAATSVERVSAFADGMELSDHDAYVVEIE